MKVRLADIAHSRAGDKGVLVMLLPYDPCRYDALRRQVTPSGPASGRIHGRVVRYEMPSLPALLFVCERTPQETVTASLYLDAYARA